MAFTSLTGAVGAVGARWKAAVWNLAIQAIQELQAGAFGTPYLQVTNNAAVTSGAKYPYNTVVTDTHSGWNSTTKIYTVPTAGRYQVVCNVQPSTAIAVAPGIYVNGTIRVGSGYVTNIASGGGCVTAPIILNASDTVYAQENGNNFTPANASTNFLILCYLGPL